MASTSKERIAEGIWLATSIHRLSGAGANWMSESLRSFERGFFVKLHFAEHLKDSFDDRSLKVA